MNTNTKINFYVMTKKGYAVLSSFITKFGTSRVATVISSRDRNIEKDYFDEIRSLCEKHNISFYERKEHVKLKGDFTFVISWRWIIRDSKNTVIFHDSLLPKYRGFSPIVSALIHKEKTIGVTALFADKEYDKGEIIRQKKINIHYPIKIAQVIDLLIPVYKEIVFNVFQKIIKNTKIKSKKQNEKMATYSLWRDEEDYHISWHHHAEDIQRFIDSVGYPYKGAFSMVKGDKIRIFDTQVEKDVHIENRQPGKILFMKNKCPVVVCGHGLLKIMKAKEEKTGKSVIPFKNFRVRFQ